MVTNIIQKAYELLRPPYWKSGKMDSGLSLSERIIGASYIAESEGHKKKMKSPIFYKEKLFETKKIIKEEMKNGKTAEDAICSYLKAAIERKEQFSESALPTGTLENGKINCVSSTALFFSLAEMLDYKLFEESCIGDVIFHVFARKKEGDGFKNID